MTVIRKKLAINDLPSIDYYDGARWVACIWERYPGSWSVRTVRVELLSCYTTEFNAVKALSFWIDISPDHIPD